MLKREQCPSASNCQTICSQSYQLRDGAKPVHMPWKPIEPNTSYIGVEHAYQNDDEQQIVSSNQVSKLKDDVERFQKKARNAEAREKRTKSTCKNLLQQISEKDLINSELEHQLQSYKDMPVELFSKPAAQYTEQQKNFALTLHLYSNKAYQFLRETGVAGESRLTRVKFVHD
ncbi:hypothetical protein ILYODFUR_021895 [Ilyodon furcidens]|uniref:THAP9-like helix-turn-helix domain-containing protein n=1 Tax=Ilyodon furcidens TaxID=33524 RepID=A0ABV0SNL5_9TELE